MRGRGEANIVKVTTLLAAVTLRPWTSQGWMTSVWGQYRSQAVWRSWCKISWRIARYRESRDRFYWLDNFIVPRVYILQLMTSFRKALNWRIRSDQQFLHFQHLLKVCRKLHIKPLIPKVNNLCLCSNLYKLFHRNSYKGLIYNYYKLCVYNGINYKARGKT